MRARRAITKRTVENLERLAAGKPPKMIRGRLGLWLPGDPPLPLQDVHPGRYRSEEVEGKVLITGAVGKRWRDHLIHIPNGGGRSKREGALLKAQGVTAGVSDYLLAIPANNKAGLWIELKAADGTLKENQSSWLIKMRSVGYAACVAWGASAALEAIDRYLYGDWPN